MAPMSGFYAIGSAFRQGTIGYFWSSTYSNAGDMFNMSAHRSGVNRQDNIVWGRKNGLAVRCIAQ